MVRLMDERAPLLGDDSGRSSFYHAFFRLFSAHHLALLSGPLATLVLHYVYTILFQNTETDADDMVGAMLGVLVWVACWWMLGPIPLAVTSLLPLVLFPFFGIMDADAVAAEYMNSVVVLLLGTFILALAIEKYNLHKRVALKILLTAGGQEMNPRSVLLGYLAAASFVSMWMSDTVAAVMMLPVAVGVLNNLIPKDLHRGDLEKRTSNLSSATEAEVDEEEMEAVAIRQFGKGLILAVTYGTALGGMATLIGSGPNVVLPGFYTEVFPGETQLSFLNFCKFSLPLLIPFFIAIWMYLIWYFCPTSAAKAIKTRLNRRMVEADYEALGPISFPEIVILIEYIILIVLWITRIFGTSPGWGVLFDNFPSDGTIAVMAAITLFLIPNRQKDGEMIMDWQSCKNMSWNVILLVGGGFALSTGIQESGLATLIGIKMQFLEAVPYYLITPVITLILSIVTEFSSNVSVASLFLPILADVAASTNIHPLLLMVPGAFACNFSFNLPSATPPNAIALGSGHLKIMDMAYPGLFMHLVSIVLISIFTPTLGAWVFGISPGK